MRRTLAPTIFAFALVLSPLVSLAVTNIDVKIKNVMHCAGCTKTVTDELAKLDAVEKDSIKVMLEGNHATLTIKKDDPTVRKTIETVLKKAGFEVETIKVVAAKNEATKTN